MTPTDSAEKVVAEWRAAMEGVTPGPWRPSRYGFQVVSDYPEPAWQSVVELTTIARSEPNVEREMLAQKTIANWLARCSPSGISGLLALIESQRATIERVERERDVARHTAKNWEGLWEIRRDGELAAEARVTALEAEKAVAGWQDISTAPKTGAVIIVCGCSFGPPVRTAYWGAGRYLGRKKGFEQAWVTNPGHSCDPQFWMPMPEPKPSPAARR